MDLDALKQLTHRLADTRTDEKEWGDVRSDIYKRLEAGLREWMKANPPGDRYKESEPQGAVWEYGDDLADSLRNDETAFRVVQEILSFNRASFDRYAKKQLASSRQSVRDNAKDIVAERFPEYPNLLRDIRETKRAWAERDVEIKKTHAFRMMGGLARMGTREESRYRDLLNRAQDLEKKSIGRILTKN